MYKQVLDPVSHVAGGGRRPRRVVGWSVVLVLLMAVLVLLQSGPLSWMVP